MINNIKNIDSKAVIFLCTLDKELYLERCKTRNRTINEKQLIRRINRIFPDEHLKHIQKLKLEYHMLDMSRELETNVKEIKQIMSLYIS